MAKAPPSPCKNKNGKSSRIKHPAAFFAWLLKFRDVQFVPAAIEQAAQLISMLSRYQPHTGLRQNGSLHLQYRPGSPSFYKASSVLFSINGVIAFASISSKKRIEMIEKHFNTRKGAEVVEENRVPGCHRAFGHSHFAYGLKKTGRSR
ncbi:UNVERIFIED_ORG: hypothetical protein ABRZ91_003679 [Heyndrickxia coagulans]